MSRTERCWRCDGAGRAISNIVAASEGKTETERRDGAALERCPECDGSGRVPYGTEHEITLKTLRRS